MSQESLRWVDKIPDSVQREKEMEVLCLGLSRTGTMCMYFLLLYSAHVVLIISIFDVHQLCTLL
jgi:hypothetical protein